MITYKFGNGLHIIGGRPLTGKTTLMLQRACASERTSLVYSLDASSDVLNKRLETVCEHSPCNPQSKIYIRDDLTAIEDICADAEGRDGDIYIDFLQPLKSKKHFDSVEDERKYIAGELYNLSRDRCVIVLSALDRPSVVCDFSPDVFRFYEGIEKIADTAVKIFVPDSCFDEENRDKISKALFVCSGSIRGIVEAGRHNESGCFIEKTPLEKLMRSVKKFNEIKE